MISSDDRQSTFFESSSTQISSNFSESSKPSKYASSTENIARLLKNWAKTPQKDECSKCSNSSNNGLSNNTPSTEHKEAGDDLTEAFESLFGYSPFDSSNSDDYFSGSSNSPSQQLHVKDEIGSDSISELAPLSMLENWLLDDHGKDYLANFSFDENPNSF